MRRLKSETVPEPYGFQAFRGLYRLLLLLCFFGGAGVCLVARPVAAGEPLRLGSSADILNLPATPRPQPQPAPQPAQNRPQPTRIPGYEPARPLEDGTLGNQPGNQSGNPPVRRMDAPDRQAQPGQQNQPGQQGQAGQNILDGADAPGQPQPGQPQPGKPAKLQGSSDLRLFGTVEFRSVLKNMPKWERVLNAMRGKTIEAAMRASGKEALVGRWAELQAKYGPNSGTSVLEKAKAVNQFFNQWPYRTDMEVYGIVDYWATVEEFVKKSGDCEDYAIAKYYALQELGVPESQLRILVVKETIRNIGHAILGVYAEGDIFILDNLSNTVSSHTRIRNYDPQYSLGEGFRWAHVRPKN